MNPLHAGFVFCVSLIAAGCAGLTFAADSRPLLALGESTFYLHPQRTNQNQVDLMIGLAALATLSRDLDKDGQCKTSVCRTNWQSTMADVALAYSNLGLHVLAVNYYREVLKNAADPASARHDVAVELDILGHPLLAQKEFDLALQSYKSKSIKFEEGLARYYLLNNNLEEARSRYEQCVLLGKPEETVQYCAIGLALTKWSGGNDSMLLGITTAGDWPGPILSFVRSQIDEKVLADRIRAVADPDRRRQRLCEALYYVGEWHLRRGDKDTALRYFKASASQRVESFWETAAAARRIEQLHGNSDPHPQPAPSSHIPIGQRSALSASVSLAA